MLEREPSRTALAAAALRAAHQVLDGGRIFADPLAITILGDEAQALIADVAARPSRQSIRRFVAARAAISDAALAQGVETRGVRQVVVLGAGLDTFAWRNPFGASVRVFEVDHPATQAWKRRRLAEVGLDIPAWLTFVPVDFERDRLGDALTAAGVDTQQRTFFPWLGVTPYLTRAAVIGTLGLIGAWSGGGEVVFDYSDPPHTLSSKRRAGHEERAARVAAAGEPFLSYFEPKELHAELATLGFPTINDLGPRALMRRYFKASGLTASVLRLIRPGGGDGSDRGGHVLFAMTPPTR